MSVFLATLASMDFELQVIETYNDGMLDMIEKPKFYDVVFAEPDSFQISRIQHERRMQVNALNYTVEKAKQIEFEQKTVDLTNEKKLMQLEVEKFENMLSQYETSILIYENDKILVKYAKERNIGSRIEISKKMKYLKEQYFNLERDYYLLQAEKVFYLSNSIKLANPVEEEELFEFEFRDSEYRYDSDSESEASEDSIESEESEDTVDSVESDPSVD
jgi:hypothetical protein